MSMSIDSMRLEPDEAESSFAAWNVLPVAVSDEYHVYRVPRRTMWNEVVVSPVGVRQDGKDG
jgi:hypothetical protein